MFKKLYGSLCLLLCVAPSALMAQTAGQVVEVRQAAQVVSEGSTRSLELGSAVSSGDLIQTGPSGQVQLLFLDETKIVVGPNSSLLIDEALFRADGTARKFATVALGGTYRFISGASPRRVYRLATPVATMGIRGTAFDYTVTQGEGTDLLVFDGLVRFCASGQRCASVPGGCQAATVLQDETFTQPLSTAEKQALLIRRFPLLADQENLLPPFRAATDGCEAFALLNLPSTPREGNDRDGGGNGGNPAEGPSDPGGGGGNPAE